MPTYRKSKRLRVLRSGTPETPFWAATIIQPYRGLRGFSPNIDFVALQASAGDRAEVEVCDDIRDALSRERHLPLHATALVEAVGFCERVFLRGAEAAEYLLVQGASVTLLISADGGLPEVVAPGASVVIAAWPPRLSELRPLCENARSRNIHWGLLIPVLFPITTELILIEEMADLVTGCNGMFLAAATIDLDATAKKEILSGVKEEESEQMWEALFHEDLETLHVATERHIAAIASERGLADTVTPPDPLHKTNWNGAVQLSIAGNRLIRMKENMELGWTLLRSARAIVELDKDISLIARNARLNIVEGIDEISAEELTCWLDGRTTKFLDEVGDRWRLRRDHHLAAI